MKSLLKLIALLFFTCSISSSLFAQTTCDKCLTPSASYTFLGIDYSLVKFIGVNEESEAKIKDTYTKGWNDLFINEQEKYDIAKTLRVNEVTYQVDYFQAKNKSIKSILQQNDPKYDVATITKHIQNNPPKGIKSDYAVWFIATAYNKSQEYGAHYFVVYDLKAKKIVVLESYSEKPRGFSFRNYWAYTYFKAMESIKSKQSKKWMK